jgi:hypothetical protein
MLARQQASGLSILRFCRRERLAVATFYNWKRRLAEGGDAGGGQARPTVGFAPVRVVPEPAESEPITRMAGGTIEIVLGAGRRVRVAGPVDRGLLADVLAVVTAAGERREGP